MINRKANKAAREWAAKERVASVGRAKQWNNYWKYAGLTYSYPVVNTVKPSSTYWNFVGSNGTVKIKLTKVEPDD